MKTISVIICCFTFFNLVTISEEEKAGQVMFNIPGLEIKLIMKEEILKMQQINRKYHTIYYPQELEEKAQEINYLLEQGDSTILAITGLEELIKFNVVIPSQKGLFYTDLKYTMIIPNGDMIFLFSVFHEQLETTLHLLLNLYKDSKNRFVGDGLANFLMWSIMERYWPEIFYKYSQDIVDKFSSSTRYNLSLWELDTSEVESEFSNYCYYIAPYFWAKIIDKSRQPELIKMFLQQLQITEERSQKEIIRIISKLSKLNIHKELTISSSEICENITKYWFFYKVPDNMRVIYGPPSDSVKIDERYDRKFVVNHYFLIDKYEITNEQFCCFLNTSGNQKEGGAYWIELDCYPEIQKIKDKFVVKPGKEKYPVRWASWYGVYAYAKWADKRLPTEAEWKKAAQTRLGVKYPWQRTVENDNGWDSTLCNWGDDGKYDGFEYTAPVYAYEKGKSAYGCYNMVGNVLEWVQDWACPLEKLSTINPIGDTGVYKIHVGGCFKYNKEWQTTYSRLFGPPNAAYSGVGFRCAKDLPIINELHDLNKR